MRKHYIIVCGKVIFCLIFDVEVASHTPQRLEIQICTPLEDTGPYLQLFLYPCMSIFFQDYI